MDANETSERERIRAAAAGNAGAFAELVQAHRLRVLRTAYRLLGSVDEAEDVAQIVFVRVWQTLERYTSQGAFSTWLYRITVNAAIDQLRRRRPLVALDDLPLAAPDQPERETVEAEETARVRRAVLSLPEAARTTLILREYEQLSYREIAEVLHVPIGTVMSRLNYARQALRKLLEDEDSRGASDAAPR